MTRPHPPARSTPRVLALVAATMLPLVLLWSAPAPLRAEEPAPDAPQPAEERAAEEPEPDADRPDAETPSEEPDADLPDAEAPSEEPEPDAARPATEAALSDEPAAAAPEPAAAAIDAPARVHHVPAASWVADSEQQIRARVERDWDLSTLEVELALEAPRESLRHEVFARACREHPGGTFDADSGHCRLALRRAPSTPEFVAVVPGAMVQPPALSYFIAGQPADGAPARPHFASAQQPWRVEVEGESDAIEETRKLERHDGHRSRFELRGDVSLFGSRLLDAQAGVETDALSDLYGGAVLSYTYRTLGWLYAFRFGVGVMRGQRATVEGEALEGSRSEPGFNWGYGEVDFELHRNFSWAGRVILGASERGFAAGVGTLMRIGPLFATHFELGVDWTMDLGVNAWMGLNWDTVPRVPMGLRVEYTTWPDADGPEGVRLLYNATWRMTEWLEAGASLGYAMRLDGLDGGVVTGLNTAVEF